MYSHLKVSSGSSKIKLMNALLTILELGTMSYSFTHDHDNDFTDYKPISLTSNCPFCRAIHS